ncbi:ATP-binding cassette domain-containing protein, partial [Priestia megaterium]|uniref:ATP-binding cassette domain-containing protein n=1 Tax=Priestia megaterium TaxID=1404 RepID=UPI0035B628AB
GQLSTEGVNFAPPGADRYVLQGLNFKIEPGEMLGIIGPSGAGKSTLARILQALMSRWPEHPRVELVTTDGFLCPNAELEARGLMQRKGFPESYDLRRMVDFL